MADTSDPQNFEEEFAQPKSDYQQEMQQQGNKTTEGTIQACEDQIQQNDSAVENEDADAVGEADSDKDTVGDDRFSDREDEDDVDDEELFDQMRQLDPARHYSISSLAEAAGPVGLHPSSSIDSLDLLAANNRYLLHQGPSLDDALSNDQSSEDFSDLVPNSSDRLGMSDSESLSSSLLDSAAAGEPAQTQTRRPSIRWINLVGDNAPTVFGSSTGLCGVCATKVYPMEMVTTNGVAYHKFCCKCAKCYRVLGVGNFGVLAGVLYCQTHYTEAVRLRDAPFEKSANSENAEPPETADPIRGRLKRRTSLADEQPPLGISKNIRNFFHGLEQQSTVHRELKYQQQQQQKQQPAVNNRLSVCTDESATPKLISPTSPAPPTAAQFVDNSSPLRRCSEEDGATGAPPSDTNIDCLPEQGTAKALLNLWRQKEAAVTGGSTSTTDAGASVQSDERRSSLVKTLGSTATEPISISRSASNLSRPKPAQIVPSPPQPLPQPQQQQQQQQEQQQQQDSCEDESELPRANNTKSMLSLWRQFDQRGAPAPNPESFERSRYQQRSLRLPRRVVDERENVDPGVPTGCHGQAAEASGELPPEGTTKNLRALFSS